MTQIQPHNGYDAQLLHTAQIMIVDDNASNLRLLGSILKKEGYTRLLSNTDAQKALSIAVASQPDLILLDLMMPEVDGFEFMERLAMVTPEDDYLPILVLTADVSQETRRRALSAGATDFLIKPFNHIEVLLRIRNLLHTRFLHKALQQQNRSLEEKVRERTDELTRTLHQLAGAQEIERRRLSMEIHDGALQALGVCTMAVDRLVRRHEQGQYDHVLSEARELRTSLNATIADLRSVLAGLSLEVLSKQGLAPALRDYIAWFSERTGINVHVDLDHAATGGLSPEVQLLMYRVAQEALSNVRKHSRADNVEVVLKIEGNDLLMSISDDGKGFAVDQALSELHAGQHLGLISMRERIRKAQGEMWVDSAPGKGTTIKFRCPSTLPVRYVASR
jgi:signal transduction histidine kinase